MPKWGETSSPRKQASRTASFARGLRRKAIRVAAQKEREKANVERQIKPWLLAQAKRAARRAADPEVKRRRIAHEEAEAARKAAEARREVA